MALVFVVLMGWAAIAPLDAGAYAPGQVAVAGNRQSIQHRDGGVIDGLHVAEGDQVTRGQVLVEIGTGELAASERALAAQLYSLFARRARLQAERNGLKILAAPQEFYNLPQEDRALAAEALQLQRHHLATGTDSRSTELGVVRRRIAQLAAQLGGYQRQARSVRDQLTLIEDELKGMQRLAEQGYAPQTRVRALERSAAQLEGEKAALEAQIASTDEQIGEANLQLRGVSFSRSLTVAEELNQVELQINEVRPRLADARARMEASRLRAPADGEVVGLTVHTLGGVAQPGQTLMEIVPKDAKQVLVVQVKPEDIDNVRLGMETDVRFTGLREMNPPKVHGTVTRVSADAMADERTGRSYFRAEVTVGPDQLLRLGTVSRSLRPGMPVETMIVLRRRTALSFLIEPLAKGLWQSRAQS